MVEVSPPPGLCLSSLSPLLPHLAVPPRAPLAVAELYRRKDEVARRFRLSRARGSLDQRQTASQSLPDRLGLFCRE